MIDTNNAIADRASSNSTPSNNQYHGLRLFGKGKKRNDSKYSLYNMSSKSTGE